MKLSWSQFKSIYESRKMDLIKIDDEQTGNYIVFGIEESLTIETMIINSDNDDCVEFETEYLPLCNQKRSKYDQSGKPFARYAIATEGMILQCMSYNFKTADKDSFRCKSFDNSTDKGYHTFKLYDINGNETTTNANAVLTRIDFEPPFDYEMVGGHIFQKSSPTSDVYAYLVALPDISEEYGGTHSMCSGGFNLAMVDKTYKIDGRAPKMLYYSPSHTNKLSFYFYHDAGFQHEIQFALEYYK